MDFDSVVIVCRSLIDRLPGATLGISYLYVPSLLLSPSPLLVRQWQKSFDVAKIAHPALALISSTAYAYVAYQWQGTLKQREAELYGVAIAANLLIWPWTLLVMMPTNKKLFKKYAESQTVKGTEQIAEVGLPKGESSKELVEKWGNLNYIRGCMPLVGALLGAYISL